MKYIFSFLFLTFSAFGAELRYDMDNPIFWRFKNLHTFATIKPNVIYAKKAENNGTYYFFQISSEDGYVTRRFGRVSKPISTIGGVFQDDFVITHQAKNSGPYLRDQHKAHLIVDFYPTQKGRGHYPFYQSNRSNVENLDWRFLQEFYKRDEQSEDLLKEVSNVLKASLLERIDFQSYPYCPNDVLPQLGSNLPSAAMSPSLTVLPQSVTLSGAPVHHGDSLSNDLNKSNPPSKRDEIPDDEYIEKCRSSVELRGIAIKYRREAVQLEQEFERKKDELAKIKQQCDIYEKSNKGLEKESKNCARHIRELKSEVRRLKRQKLENQARLSKTPTCESRETKVSNLPDQGSSELFDITIFDRMPPPQPVESKPAEDPTSKVFEQDDFSLVFKSDAFLETADDDILDVRAERELQQRAEEHLNQFYMFSDFN